MPTLERVGEKAVGNHHRDVSCRLIHCDKNKSVGDPDVGNRLGRGDNLDAFTGPRIVYAEGCAVPDDRLSGLGVTYQIEGL